MPTEYCIKCTLPRSYCVCLAAPTQQLRPDFSILFHPRELQRRNSTGRLLKMCCNIQSQSWHRLKNESLALHYTDYCLLYPTEQPDEQTVHVQTINTQTKPTQFLLLDATWQESRKMLNQSKWLNALPKYAITQAPSHYQLRRNQTEQGMFI